MLCGFENGYNSRITVLERNLLALSDRRMKQPI